MTMLGDKIASDI